MLEPVPAEPAVAAPPEKPSELLPGNFPFPKPSEFVEQPLAGAPHAPQPAQPPPLYPPLPRGLTPFKPPTVEERRLLRLADALKQHYRSSVCHHGERDGEIERRVREGDVARWGDGVPATRDGDDDEDGDANAEDDDDDDDVRWVRRFMKLERESWADDDESIVPREILEAARGAERVGGSKKRASDGPVSPKRARGGKRARMSGDGREEEHEEAKMSAREREGLSRLERLARLESRAESEGDRAGRTSERDAPRSSRERSTSKNPSRRGGGGEDDDDDDDDENQLEEDDDLDSDDDYARANGFDDDEGLDDDLGDDGDGEAFFM